MTIKQFAFQRVTRLFLFIVLRKTVSLVTLDDLCAAFIHPTVTRS